MRGLSILLSLTLLLALAAACRGPADDASGAAATTGATGPSGAAADAVRLELPADPTVGEVRLRVYLLDGGDGVSDAEVEVTGTMTHAGMVPVVRDAAESDPGLYVVDDFEFTMAGDWVVTAEATLPDGREVADETTVTVRQP